MENVLNKSVGQIVAEDYRMAQVFKNHNIDFCCNGNRNLEEVAISSNLTVDELVSEIETIKNTKNDEAVDYKSWPLDLLADYIEKKHHRYVEEQIPVLKQYLEKLCRVHGNNHPELFEIDFQFKASASELASHMKKEELILFPAVRRMVQAERTKIRLPENHFGSVKNPIQSMMAEHDTEGDRFRHIETLSSKYTPPADACNTYRVTFSLLQEFESDLHRHIHLENNILFPGALRLEEKLENN
ncbi:iron-sulfur cluster repair di-iron protein [Ulvibacter antarcticus]|uniref:Regulator of cell morphogenesis and NO signaling n=1 Tax=Ulvibacter antarcticus TaxID=442714 RepID=A0A3L9YGP2_9FLAO|nr:iron-sulfur cluster repair di-iron protein [Ulvibacter antarcticus]RMA58717.1 regulator of cell morphogenesis and NO signaling [Ulvibacter antarcticus]